MVLKRVVTWLAGLAFLAFLAVFIVYWMSDNSCNDGTMPQGELMKAVIHCDYGTAEVLQMQDRLKPTPSDKQILVKVHAAAVNPLDWHYMRGTPYIMRISTGLRKPKELRLGVDFAGTVQAVGKDVTRFKPGDEVYGGATGAFAQYVLVSEHRAIAPKPPNMSFEQAASVPVAALTALQALRDSGKLQSGQKVLINGASGGVGTFAVQIAKSFGAGVTGVSSARNHELVRSLGADRMIDYTTEDFTRDEQRYDVILDLVGNHSLLDLKRVLQPQGIVVLVGGGGPDAGSWIAPLLGPIKALLLNPFVDQEFGMMLAELNQQDLTVLADLMQTGKVTPVIDRQYSLSEIADAVRYLETGRARGKVVISVP